MDVLKAIKERRTVREFTDEKVSDTDLKKILEAGRWAPSGKNTQPWRFIMVKDKEKRMKLAECVSQSEIVRKAAALVAVMLDNEAGYNRDKDMQAIGACVQNMLLAAWALGLGACWIGGITAQREKAEKILTAKESEEIALLLVIGHPTERERTSTRIEMKDLVREV